MSSRALFIGAVVVAGCSWLAPIARAQDARGGEQPEVSAVGEAASATRDNGEAKRSGTASSWLRMSEAAASRYGPDIREIALRHGLSPALVEAVIHVESAFNPTAVSRKGARGLMQLMPQTANALGVQDSFDPRQNIDGGVRHLRRLIDRYPGDLTLALAAYNAGEGAVDFYGGIPPYPETQQYVRKVLQQPAMKAAAVSVSSSPSPAIQRVDEQDRGAASGGDGDTAMDRASPPRRLTLRPAEPTPSLPLIDAARRSSRSGLTSQSSGSRLESRALAKPLEPISQMLARMKDKKALTEQSPAEQ